MSESINEKPHRRGSIHCETVFWNGNTAGNEDNATRAVVTAGPYGYGEIEYRWPEQRLAEELSAAIDNPLPVYNIPQVD